MVELSTRYNPQETEEKWLKFWKEHNTFHAKANPSKKPYCIVIPPPNVTGILHMGHALNNTLQDITIRFKRMQGFETCWMPGTDHAGIATQNVVEKQLAKEGKTRHDVGREEFLKRLWQWKQEYGDTIIRQLERLGCSCDWPRTRFTMDEGYSRAVKTVFVKLYEKGLIYRGQYIINWCPRCETALSDEESEHRETQGALYYIRYPLKDHPQDYVVVATTRPETMLGDTAVAVHPKDKRYKNLIGKALILPLMKREIKILADEFVDPKFGTGAVKVTPAHDPNDFLMGQRHQLKFVNIMHPDARLNENAGDFCNMDRFEAREAIVEELKEQKLIEKIEPHTHAVGHCYRCHSVIEPYLSKQWFVKMKPLAKPATEVVRKNKIKFFPARWSKVYLNWMDNIRDWCISRQIWWGHRIPVWYCQDCPDDKNIIVSADTPECCPQCQSRNLHQDEDVLDTWFSSWLWPLATFGWPQKNEDLDFFYPTSSLFTASEIIFFWVARMIMAGLEFKGDIPFSDVYIHGTVRDAKGLKMSKSLGNAIDPLEIIKDYGADALRFSLIINSGQDLFISKEKFEIGRNFANKIWNASRLALMNIQKEKIKPIEGLSLKTLDLPSRWILSQLTCALEKINKAIEHYRFSEAENLIYEFFWKNYCDWYLEIIKDRFNQSDIQSVAYHVLEQSLRILHPFMPFVTEEIWHHLTDNKDSLALYPWPKIQKSLLDKSAQGDMETMIELISTIRNIRAQWHVEPTAKIACLAQCPIKKQASLLKENSSIIQNLGRIETVTIKSKMTKPKGSVTGLAGKIKFYIPLTDIVDLAKEKKNLEAQIEAQTNMRKGLLKRLKNKEFLKKAPQEVIQKERLRLESIQIKFKELKKTLSELL
ncbi:MAG: valine--tRNA ligase [Candidatus Omnitrophota bacterium]